MGLVLRIVLSWVGWCVGWLSGWIGCWLSVWVIEGFVLCCVVFVVYSLWVICGLDLGYFFVVERCYECDEFCD